MGNSACNIGYPPGDNIGPDNAEGDTCKNADKKGITKKRDIRISEECQQISHARAPLPRSDDRGGPS